MIEINAVQYLMNDKPFYLGIMKAGDLVKNFKIDTWSISNPTGYQRNLSKTRSKKFGVYLGKCKGIFHQTILINIRNKENINYKDGIAKISGEFYLVDGQHRVGGVKSLLEAQPSFDSLPIPVL